MAGEWWKNSAVYQIYPQSFQDSNNDGIGDLNGIRQRLDYIQNLGAEIIWLNPIYQSPLVDNGYDISDYKAINPIYGTLDDFKALIKEAHEKGIRIVMDLVVNHTSDQHAWFKESCKSKDNPYSDYYIWKDPKADGSAPNDWGSTFGGPAWEYVESRGQYYLHCFAKEQPDLNWENENVRQDVYDQMRFWLDLGVDGFRMDVISLLSKDQAYPDNNGRFDYAKSYYAGASNGPRIHEFLQEMNREVLSHYDVITVGETPNTSSSQALLYTDPKRHELSMVFQFEHMHLDYGKYGKFSPDKVNLIDLKDNLSLWQEALKEGWNSLYWDNHDQPRAVSRFGNDSEEYRVVSAKMLASLLHGMKGTPYIFQGEEIGMKNGDFGDLKNYQDIETRFMIERMRDAGEEASYIEECIYNGSRDNARTPMAWNDQKPYYGFSKHQPWIYTPKDGASINVEEALADPDSVFYHYKKLLDLRKNLPVLQEGDYTLLDHDNPNVFSYRRDHEGQSLYVICNFTDHAEAFPLSLPDSRLILSNYKDTPENGADVKTLRSYEAAYYLASEGA